MRICLKQGISGGFKHKEPKKKTCQLSVIITLNGITYQHVCIIISAAPWLNDSTVAMEFMGQKWGQVGWRPIKVIDGWESPRRRNTRCGLKVFLQLPTHLLPSDRLYLRHPPPALNALRMGQTNAERLPPFGACPLHPCPLISHHSRRGCDSDTWAPGGLTSH